MSAVGPSSLNMFLKWRLLIWPQKIIYETLGNLSFSLEFLLGRVPDHSFEGFFGLLNLVPYLST
jgi:hypothetical protein